MPIKKKRTQQEIDELKSKGLSADFGKSGGGVKIGENLKADLAQRREADPEFQKRKTQAEIADKIRQADIATAAAAQMMGMNTASTPETAQATQEQTTQQTQEQPQEVTKPKTKGITAIEGNSPIAKINQFGQSIGAGSLKESVTEPAVDLFTVGIGKIYDVVQSVFSGGKGIEQKEAEATFADIKASLAGDLQLVTQGIKDPQEITAKLSRARGANARLQESIKGLNKVNLRYFVLHGADVEAQLIENEELLVDYENQLEAMKSAKLQSQINSIAAMQRLGLQ